MNSHMDLVKAKKSVFGEKSEDLLADDEILLQGQTAHYGRRQAARESSHSAIPISGRRNVDIYASASAGQDLLSRVGSGLNPGAAARHNISVALGTMPRVTMDLFEEGTRDGNQPTDLQLMGISRRKQHQAQAEIKQHKDKYALETELDLATIEDVDQAIPVDVNKAAEVPLVHATEQVHSVRDLESGMSQRLKDYLLSKDVGLDMSPLLAHLLPEQQVQEPLEEWDEGDLMRSLAAEVSWKQEQWKESMVSADSAGLMETLLGV